MQIWNARAVSLCAAVAILAGCSAGGSPPTIGTGFEASQGGVKALFQGRPPFIAVGQTTVNRDRRKSWRSDRLRKEPGGHLLFISDSGTDDVYIYQPTTYTLMATLTGFNLPQGMCSDNAGDVWVANTYSFQILELNHAGSIINTLSDPAGWPVGCAWNSQSGNLAVTNIVDFDSQGHQVPGEVLVYPGATGAPTAYQDPHMWNYYSAAYQANGNLYFDGFRDYANTEFGLDVIRANAPTPVAMEVNGGTIYAPGGLQWHQGLLVGDQECGGGHAPEVSCVYQLSVSHFVAAIVGSTTMKNSDGYPVCDVVQAILGGQTLYGGDFEYSPVSGYTSTSGFSCSDPSPTTAVDRWPFPAGGSPQRFNTSPFTSASVPNGTAISI